MIKYRVSQISACLNIFGTILLFFSFQATSSDFMLVTTKDERAALCVGNAALFVLDQRGGLGIGTKCPDWQTGRPTAVVNTEHPSLASSGLFLLILGFLTQLISIEQPKKEQPKKKKWEK
jgi:hypothetical protein